MRLARLQRLELLSCVAMLAMAGASGCASRGNVDLLEARLRHQEDELRSLHAEAERTQAELLAARRLNEALKKQTVQPATHQQPTELTEEQFRVVRVKINSLLTGGFDRDGQPGDDQLTLVFAPHDERGRPLRVPGTVECELIDPTQTADERILGRWKFSESQLRDSWHELLGKPTYRIELPWQRPPVSDTLEVRLRFRTIHGDEFDTSATVTITPPTPAKS